MERFAQAYVAMAKVANYRPAAPGDGCGHTYLTKEQARDPTLLINEAAKYAHRLSDEEDTRSFVIGCTNFRTNQAFVFVVEAARSLCGAKDDLALELLQLAMREIEDQTRKRKAAGR